MTKIETTSKVSLKLPNKITSEGQARVPSSRPHIRTENRDLPHFQSECGKMRTSKSYGPGHPPCSEYEVQCQFYKGLKQI